MIKNLARNILKSDIGYKLFKKFYYLSVEMDLMHPDLDEEFTELKTKCLPHTMTTVESLYYTYRSAKYVIENNIPGDFVECGVWSGTSKLFEILYMLIWYLGPMNKITELDYIGSHGNGRPEFFIPFSIVLIVFALIGRTRQIRT